MAETQFNAAVFSGRQAFWNKETGNKPVIIGIAPVTVNDADYSETIPCDSCRWLSINGVQWSLETYLFHAVDSVTSAKEVKPILPHEDLVKVSGVSLPESLDSLDVPLLSWLAGLKETLIYRPKDRFTGPETKKTLSRLGGALNLSHILLARRVVFRVQPVNSNKNMGKLDFSFYLIFWNVSLSFPEWVIYLKVKTPLTDLNLPLKHHLDNQLLPRLAKLPGNIRKIKNQEPK